MSEEKPEVKWKALESNPDVLTNFARKLGLSEEYSFFDIWSIDEENFGFFPPLVSLVFLFPSASKLPAEDVPVQNPENVFYITQIPELGNACGTIAVLHSLANNYKELQIADDSVFGTFYNRLLGNTSQERGEALNNDPSLNDQHNSCAEEGDNPVQIDNVEYHFVAFTKINGDLYELDGCKKGPINHGNVPDDSSFISVATKKIKELYLEPNPDLQFVLIGLGKNQEDD